MSGLPQEGRGFTYIVNGTPYPVGNETETLLDTNSLQSCVHTGYGWRCSALKERLVGGEYGYIAGHSGGNSIIDRIVFPFSSGTASISGNLARGCYISPCCNSSLYGYVEGGFDASVWFSTIQRMDFQTNSTAIVSSLLPQDTCYSGGFNSSLHGFTVGSNYPSGSTSSSFITRLNFATVSNAVNMASLQQASHVTSTCNSSTHGHCLSGRQSGVNVSYAERISFPFDSGPTLLINNPRPVANSFFAGGFNSSLYGYILGGILAPSTSYYSEVDKIVFPWNSGQLTTVSNMSTTGYGSAAVNSTNYGFRLAVQSANNTSNIDRLSFALDTGVMTVVGNITTSKNSPNAFDNTDFIAQFV